MAIPNEQLEDFPRSSGSHFSVNKSVKTIDTNDQLFKSKFLIFVLFVILFYFYI